MSPNASITRGFAICLPGGSVLGRTYRETADEARSAIFTGPFADALWKEKEAAGWSVRPVVAVIDLEPTAYPPPLPFEGFPEVFRTKER